MKRFVVVILLLICKTLVYSQAGDEVSKLVSVSLPKGPEAQAYQKFGNIPVDYSAGLPNISFPLYELNAGRIGIPISLTYHSGGIKVNEVAGSVGLGFLLNAGGRINRTIIDKDDYGNNSVLNFKTPEEYENARNIAYQTSANAGDTKLETLATQIWYDQTYCDRNSDRYNLYLPNGKSVIFRKDFLTGVFEQMPFENLKIEYISSNHSFKITDCDGSIYKFEDADDDGWNLTKVETQGNNNYVEFTYGDIQLRTFYTPPTFVESSSTPLSVNRYENPYGSGYCYNLNLGIYPISTTQEYSSNQGSSASNSLITKMANADIEVNFTYTSGRFDPGSRKLAEITVIDKHSLTIVRKIVFNYSNFGTINDKTWRLKLSSFSIVSPLDNTVNDTYTFNYNEEVILPPYFDINYHHFYHEDFWGYYNGTNALRNIPIQLVKNSSNGNDRYPNPSFTNACSLTEVIYPTGGKTTYEMESNYGVIYEPPFIVSSNGTGYGGGLRVKSIKNFTSNGTLADTKTFVYSGGAPNSINSALYSYEKRIVLTLDPLVLGYEAPLTVTLSEPADYIRNEGLQPVFYGEVKEYNGTLSDNTGYTQYEFALPIRHEQNAYEFFNMADKHAWQWDYGIEKAHLLHKRDYKKEGNGSYTVLRSEDYEYSNLFKYRKFTTGINLTKRTTYRSCLGGENIYWPELSNVVQSGPSSQSQIFCLALGPNPAYSPAGANYYFLQENIFATKTSGYISANLLTKKNVYENTIAGIIEMEEQYEYDPEYLNLRKVISKTSKGDITEFEYKYPSDFPGTTPYNSMLSNNILINPIQKTITNITKNKELSKEKYNYQSWQNNSMFLPGFIEKSSGGSPLEIYAVVNEYDSKGNIIQVTGKDGIINSFIWGYNQQYLIAKVINRTYDDVISQSGINLSIVNNPTTETELKAELNKLRTISNAFVTTYTYKPLVGMTSESDPNGRTKYYEYDNFNRLALIRDQDGKILKKICYNYAGQPENCTSPCPPNSPPDWQNTTTPPTCQQGSCGNTGYQLQEQKDMNPCSSSYNTLQLVTVYNPTACPPANGVTITGNNISGLSGFTARYTNNATGQIYTFNVPTTTNTAIGCIPAGTYTLYISKPGNTMYLSFGTGCNFTVTGTSATFGRVSVTQTSGCNQVIIDGLAAD